MAHRVRDDNFQGDHATLDGIETVEQAAARTGCSSTTIWRRIMTGELPSRRLLGRTVVRAVDVDKVCVRRYRQIKL